MSDFLIDERTEEVVPRPTEPRNAREVAAVERRTLPLGWWGMAMLVASEGTLFGTFVGTYFYLRFHTPHWPPAGISRPGVTVPVILVSVLTATAVPMRLAARAAYAGRVAALRGLIALALFVQSGYFAYEVWSLRDQLRSFTPATDAYGSIYYVMLGADHAHVFVGLLLDLWLLGKLATGLTPYRATATWAISFYWLAVIAITLVVTGTLLSAAA